MNKKPKLQARALKVSQRLEKSPIWVLLTYRFIYGFKIVILLVAGISNIAWSKVAFWTAISTLLWITAFGWLGYYCGNEVIDQFHAIGDYKWHAIGSVLVGVLLYMLIFRWRKFKRDCKSVGIEM